MVYNCQVNRSAHYRLMIVISCTLINKFNFNKQYITICRFLLVQLYVTKEKLIKAWVKIRVNGGERTACLDCPLLQQSLKTTNANIERK